MTAAKIWRKTERVKNILNSQLKIQPCADWERVKITDARTKLEKQAIYRFRYQIYVQEMGRNIPDADFNKKRIMDDMDSWSYLIYAELDGRIVGTARITIGKAGDFSNELNRIFRLDEFGQFDPRSKNICFATKLMVDPSLRKTPLFFRLMARIYEIMREQNIQFSFGGCNPYLVPMYEQMGYRQFSPGFQDPGYGFVLPVLFVTEDVEHLTAVRSPYLRIARKLANSPAAKQWMQDNLPDVLNYPVGQLADEQRHWDYVAERIGTPLTTLPVLRNLTREEAEKFLQVATPFECGERQGFICVGDTCNELNLLIAGEMRITDASGLSWRADPGEIVGSVGLFGQTHHDINAIAISDCEILAISRFPFEKLLRAHPDLAENLIFSNLRRGTRT